MNHTFTKFKSELSTMDLVDLRRKLEDVELEIKTALMDYRAFIAGSETSSKTAPMILKNLKKKKAILLTKIRELER